MKKKLILSVLSFLCVYMGVVGYSFLWLAAGFFLFMAIIWAAKEKSYGVRL